MQRIVITMLLGLLAGTTARASALESLDAAVAIAREANPRLAAAHARAAAVRAQAGGVRTLPDPRLTVTQALQPVETRVGPQRQTVSLMQPLPWFGTLGARGERADLRATAAEAEAEAQVLDVTARTAAAWWRLAATDRTRLILDQHRALQAELATAVRAAYAAGRAGFGDVQEALAELDRLDERRAAADRRRSVHLAALNALLARADDAPAKPVLPDSLAWLDLDPAALADAAVAHSPALQAATLHEDAARAGVRVASLENRPDLNLGVAWLRHGPARNDGVPDSGRDAYVVSLGLALPLRGGAREAADTAAARDVSAAAADAAAARHALRAEVIATAADHADAQGRWVLDRRRLLPAARRTLDALRAAYAAGDARVEELTAAARRVLDLELDTARAAADALAARARLAALTATPLPGGSS